MKALDTFSNFSDFEKFSCLLCVARPDFYEYPDWAKSVAFNYYTQMRDVMLEENENQGDFKEIINRQLWNASVMDTYCKVSAKALGYEAIFEQQPELLQSYDSITDASTSLKWGHQLFELPTDNPNILIYSEDFNGDLPIFMAEFDEDKNTKNVLLYNHPIDLSTGKVAALAEDQPTLTEEQENIKSTAETRQFEKPTKAQWSRYLSLSEILKEDTRPIYTKKTMGRALYRLNKVAEERGIDSEKALGEYFAARRSAQENEQTVQQDLTSDQAKDNSQPAAQDEKPTGAQLRRYRAMSEILGEDTRFVPSKSEMRTELKYLDKIAQERGIDPSTALNEYYQNAREKNKNQSEDPPKSPHGEEQEPLPESELTEPENSESDLSEPTTKQDVVQGYKIIESMAFEDNPDRGAAIGHNPNAVNPFVSWIYSNDENGNRGYDWGRYCNTHEEASRFSDERLAEHQIGKKSVSDNAVKSSEKEKPRMADQLNLAKQKAEQQESSLVGENRDYMH